MRDRLIELRRKAWVEWQQSATEVDFEEYCADYLIAKGVIVPPVKVGQTVYAQFHNYGKKYTSVR